MHVATTCANRTELYASVQVGGERIESCSLGVGDRMNQAMDGLPD